MRRPVITIHQILGFADAFHQRTGKWPTRKSGPVPEVLDLTWTGVHVALRHGNRGLPGGTTLPNLLAAHRGVRNRLRLPHFTIEQILRWADAEYQQSGIWPTAHSSAILDAPTETWFAVDRALSHGNRGLPGGSSLAQLLKEHRALRVHRRRAPYTVQQILDWADAHRARTGRWPTRRSGPIPGARFETWMMVHQALLHGKRGLPGGSSLPRFLLEHRGARSIRRPPLRLDEIRAWADAHCVRTGNWPTARSGRIQESARDTWLAVDMALRNGTRGLRGGTSLYQLLHGDRLQAVRPHTALPETWPRAEQSAQETTAWPSPTSRCHEYWLSVASASSIEPDKPKTPTLMHPLDLSAVDSLLHRNVQKAFDTGDAIGFVCTDTHAGLVLLFDNLEALKERGILEECIVEAFRLPFANHEGVPISIKRSILAFANREQLRQAGEPLPGPGPFRLYCGIAGKTTTRTLGAQSWTATLARACWWALRVPLLETPTVIETTAQAEQILFYFNGQFEKEFVVEDIKSFRRVRLPQDRMRILANQFALANRATDAAGAAIAIDSVIAAVSAISPLAKTTPPARQVVQVKT